MNEKKNRVLYYISFMILMIALGCSDALRGVFAPVFNTYFNLDGASVSLLITVSYLGNFVFMLFGSKIADRLGVKMVFILGLFIWIGALLIYILTNSYIAIVVGVFFALGSSTLLNTLINISTQRVYINAGFVVNTLFFMQGIGTVASQSIIGRFATGMDIWKVVNIALLILGVISLVIFIVFLRNDPGLNIVKSDKINEESQRAGGSFGRPIFWDFVSVFGLYFIGEHGVMNWMNIYGIEALGLTPDKSGIYPAMFFGSMTVGRLLLAPVVFKIGNKRSIMYSFIVGTILYLTAIFIGGGALYLLLPAGFAFAIVYPTLTLFVQDFFEKEIVVSSTGAIISIATAFDIFFNFVFGKAIDIWGYDICMKILPVSMLIATAVFVVMMKVKRN